MEQKFELQITSSGNVAVYRGNWFIPTEKLKEEEKEFIMECVHKELGWTKTRPAFEVDGSIGSPDYERGFKHYQVFRVNVCTSDWAIDYVLIGGESVDDVAANLKEAFSLIDKKGKKHYYEQNRVKRVVEEKDRRIKPVENLYTTTPYKILDRYAYSE